MLDGLKKTLFGLVSEGELYTELWRALNTYDATNKAYQRFKKYEGLYSLVNDPKYEDNYKKLCLDVERVQKEAVNKRATVIKERMLFEAQIQKSLGYKDVFYSSEELEDMINVIKKDRQIFKDVNREELEDAQKRVKELKNQEEKLFKIVTSDENAISSLDLLKYGSVGEMAKRLRYVWFSLSLNSLHPENIRNRFLREYKTSQGELENSLQNLDKQASAYFGKVEVYLKKNKKLPSIVVGDDAVLKNNLITLLQNKDIADTIIHESYPMLSKLKNEGIVV